jgi:nucleoside permease NupC
MSEFMNCYFSDECSVLDAATKGAITAIQLVLGIIANIIAFVSFIAFLNGLLSWLGMLVGAEGLTFEVRSNYVLILFLMYEYILFWFQNNLLVSSKLIHIETCFT